MQRKKTFEPRHKKLTGKERRQQHAHISPPVATRELCKAAIEHLQQRRYLITQCVTGSGQRQRPGLSLEEAHTHQLLEFLHLMAHRRWRESKLICSSFEAAMARG